MSPLILEAFLSDNNNLTICYAIPRKPEQEIEIFTCTKCNGEFGVDTTFLDQTSKDHVNCPMCMTEQGLGEDNG